MTFVIDIHNYVQAPTDLYYERAINLGERNGGVVSHMPKAAEVEHSAAAAVADMDRLGIDIRLIAPQPHHLMQSEPELAPTWIRNCNDLVAAQCAASGGRLKGLAALLQIAGEGPQTALDEIDRCDELGFVGVMLSPDPGEGDGRTPGLGDPWWYPLWEKLTALDLPALVVSGGCRDLREGYSSHFVTEADIAAFSLTQNPEVFEAFPDLKLIIGYGGGSMPYQIGRWRAHRTEVDFDAALRKLWFDTLVHTPRSLDMLLRVCGPDRCLFGADRPGAATVVDPKTGRSCDDIGAMIDDIGWLSPDDRTAIYSGNARRLFTRLGAEVAA